MRKNLTFLLFIESICHFKASADWDIASIQTVDNNCALSNLQVDDSKLSMRINGFTMSVGDIRTARGDASIECKSQMSFLLPAHHRLGTFTHRVTARAAKDEHVELKMGVAINSESTQFAFRGVLPFGTRFDDRVLLYKSFDARNLIDCSESQQRLVLNFSWTLEVLKKDLAKTGFISMEDGRALADTWLSTEECSLFSTEAR